MIGSDISLVIALDMEKYVSVMVGTIFVVPLLETH